MKNINLFNNSFYAMNTRFEAVFYGEYQEKPKIVFNKIKEAVKQIELLLSSYYEQSEIYKINKSQYINSFEVSDELFEIILLCDSYKKKTLSLYDYLFDESFIYNNDQTNPNKTFSDCKIRLNKVQKKLIFTGQKYYFDFGAVGKGIALQKVSEILIQNNIENIFVSFGESSILTRGKHPHGPHWPFSLVNMLNSEEQLANLKLNNHFISTSATFQKTDNEVNKYHIINPKKGEYITTPKMICVKSDCPIEAEILSTALLVADKYEQEIILEKFKNYEIIEVRYNSENHPQIRKFYD